MEIPNLNIGVVVGPDDVVKFWDWLTDRPLGYVAIDVETGNTDPDKDARHWYEPGAHVRMVQFGDSKGGWAIPMQGWEKLVEGAFEWLNQHRIKQVWHNGFTFDATYLEYCHGIKLDPTLTEDTFVYAGLIGYAEDSRELKRIAEFQLGPWAAVGQDALKTGMKNGGWNWSTVPMTWMPYPIYGVMDTCMTAMLWEEWEAERKRVKYFHAREIATAAMTNQACMTGIMLDGAYLGKTYRTWSAEAKRLEALCIDQGWGQPSKTDHIRKILAEANVLDDTYLTDGGLISVDKKQLTLAAHKHPLAQLVLDWRWTDRVANNYLRKLWAKIDHATTPAVVHPSIWTMEARTSRMSVSDPPFQQFPASDPTVRKAVISSGRDEVLIAADYGQIEVRGWAALYEDKVMLDLINESDRTGEDYFVLVARQLFNDPSFAKSNPLRKPVKNASYALQYGASVAKIAEMIGMPLEQVEPIVRALRDTFPSYADGGMSKIDEEGGGIARTVLPDGRSFQVHTWGEIRKLPNYRVQGWAAGVLKDAMLSMNASGLGPYLRMLVHDEVILSAPKNIAQEVAVEMRECMNAIVDPADYGVSVTAEPTIGARWSALKD